FFPHVMLRLDDERAQRDVVGIDRATIVHGDREETGERRRLAVGINLLQVPTERFLALIEAAANLKTGNLVERPRMSGVRNEGVERLVAVTALKSQVINSPPLQARKRLHF